MADFIADIIGIETALFTESAHYKYLADLVRNKNYKKIIEELQGGEEAETNMALDFHFSVMTGLEFAIYQEDLQMTAIFFSFGADPKNNVFDGVIHNQGSYMGYGSPTILPGFDGENEIPGFDGLNLLVGDEEHKGKAYVWLMRALYQDGTISVHRHLREFIDNIETVSEELQYSGNDFRCLVKSTLMCMKLIGMSNDVAIRIVEEMVLATLWMLIRSHALRGRKYE